MIHLFTGDDAKNKRIVYEKFVKSIPKSTETLFINRNNFNETQIESLYSGAGLFFSLSAVIFEGVLEREETRDFILEKLALMGESKNTFVFLKVNCLSLSWIFLKNRAKRLQINIFELPKRKKKKNMIIFSGECF